MTYIPFQRLEIYNLRQTNYWIKQRFNEGVPMTTDPYTKAVLTVIESVMTNHPGITRQEVEEMATNLGF